MKNRFDLEQQIMDCWGVVDDVKILYEHVMEDDKASTDSIANTLLGIKNLYGLKFEKLFRTFESVISSAISDEDLNAVIKAAKCDCNCNCKEVPAEVPDNRQPISEQVDELVGFPVDHEVEKLAVMELTDTDEEDDTDEEALRWVKELTDLNTDGEALANRAAREMWIEELKLTQSLSDLNCDTITI